MKVGSIYLSNSHTQQPNKTEFFFPKKTTIAKVQKPRLLITKNIYFVDNEQNIGFGWRRPALQHLFQQHHFLFFCFAFCIFLNKKNYKKKTTITSLVLRFKNNKKKKKWLKNPLHAWPLSWQACCVRTISVLCLGLGPLLLWPSRYARAVAQCHAGGTLCLLAQFLLNLLRQ